jgi:hypothetical protein
VCLVEAGDEALRAHNLHDSAHYALVPPQLWRACWVCLEPHLLAHTHTHTHTHTHDTRTRHTTRTYGALDRISPKHRVWQ